jgi:hypothetical protein
MLGREMVPERHQNLMREEREVVPETSVIFNQLTRLIVREDFINFALVRDIELTRYSDVT